ncbi:RIP metalloprotease RseP [Bacteroides sp. 214]|uniref:RIP metalloprotease RseP n=1 Tax=Bacteroides sp. 214 TaxID=2302935 RepID=UPI0013D0E118|nr:RIP metalloprotease RseP [Bacteroides sp. 214]NDW11761.1 RIP metalloprotease RseP [Bacteroides sp. 214]
MEVFLIRALQLIMSLSLLVIIHEGGHFLFARLFKIRVEKFCLFFDPWFTLFKFKPKKSDTEYAVGWLPLGGYVKISGMIDESMDTEQMKQPAQPWEFRSKPAGQRLLVMVGGVLFNFLLALFIYSMILFTWGDSYISVKDLPLGMEFSETAKKAGFQDGDILLLADGVPFDRYEPRKLIDSREVTVRRDGKEMSVYIPEDMMQLLMASNEKWLADYRFSYVVDSVAPGSPAMVAGLLSGDSIVGLNDKEIVAYSDYTNEIARMKKENASRELLLSYYRGGELHQTTAFADSAYIIGTYITNASVSKRMPLVKVSYGFFESFPAGIMLGVNTLKGYVSDMRHVFTKEGAKQLGGFATIGSIFPAKWDWHKFWYMTAFLSIILAFMNILPIPALDGGHVLFLLYEIVARRKPSDKFMEYAQVTGMLLLFGLLIWANFNDVLRFLF